MGNKADKGQKTDVVAARPFRETTPAPDQAKNRSLSRRDFVTLGAVTMLALAVRYYRLWQPSSVVFDEVHFGGFARKYIIGRFFMDVHPPLAKMLYAVVGYLAGYDGEFEFKTIGLDYIEPGVPYVAMRMLPATLGIFTILLSYSTLRATGCRPLIAGFGAGLVTIDNALTTQSRYILLDSPLIFFMAITVYAFRKFGNEVPFRKDWFRYLFLTGLGLGATVTSKWVGLFTIGWVGILTVYQLWWLLGDLRVSACSFTKHFLWRAVFLIAVPIGFYMALFAIHFICVVNDGDGASFMSPEFQSTLQHTKLGVKTPADVAYGSEITIRHLNTQGGYLHSHDHMYETGSKQQQITLYPHKDENNIWVVENFTLPEPEDYFQTNKPVFIEDGAVIRLKHKSTNRRLHSHDHRPPISEQEHNNEVSAYGYEGFGGDANDDFRVEIVEKYSEKGPARSRLRTVQTKFRLVHTITGCTLFSHNVKLPKWAFEQQEVTCIKGGTLPNSIWFVEENYHPMYDETAEMVSYRKPSFLEKFIELNKVMWRVNAGLTETHTWESRPGSWPIMKRGINFWVKDNRQVYLLGNGPVWWAMGGLIGLYVVFKAISILRWQRGYNDFAGDADFSKFDTHFGAYVLGWALHYFPSFLMERQLFLHHYLGSVYFGILALAQFWEFLVARLLRNRIVSSIATVLFFGVAASWFVWYSPLIYASPWTKELCNKSKFFDMDFDCNAFLDSYDDYTQSTIPATPETVLDVPSDAPADQAAPAEDNSFGETEEGQQPQVEVSELQSDPGVTPSASKDSFSMLGQEQSVEYRDENGDLMDPEIAQKLIAEGNVEVRTQSSTANRYFDKDGNEIH
uniref:Dolichyl-phosphate-mannose--protein mannosyltransferase n=1 Tax=Blastobotrys adeninivorans TaxID=409370 RepID=A0A060T6Y3_BLAAD